MNHVHRLYGFIIKDNEYLISTTAKRGKGTIYINANFGKWNKHIKNIIKIDLSHNKIYSSSKDYYVSLSQVVPTVAPRQKHTRITADVRNSAQVQVQVGGAEFPLALLPYNCDGAHLDLAPVVVPLYSEPSISYIESLGALSHASLLALHAAIGDAYFDPHIALVTAANYADRSYKKVLLMHHLLHNKYAHNGIGSPEDMAGLTGMFGDDSYKTLQLIHSLCHMYDALYMHQSGSEEFETNKDLLEEYSSLVTDDRQRSCLMRMINKNHGDFLLHDGDRLVLPYSLVPAAIPDKERQYGRSCYSYPPQLIPSIRRNLCLHSDNVQTGTTIDMPNS